MRGLGIEDITCEGVGDRGYYMMGLGIEDITCEGVGD